MAPSSICSSPKIPPYHYRSRSNKKEVGLGPRTSPSSLRVVPCAVTNEKSQISSIGSLFCYDKPIPEEIIEEPVGITLPVKGVGDDPHCPICQAKGAILCTTCSGSGLYVDSILESQGIIVKVRCLEVIMYVLGGSVPDMIMLLFLSLVRDNIAKSTHEI